MTAESPHPFSMSSEGSCSPAGQETGILRSRLLLLTVFLPLPPSCSPSALVGGSFHVGTLGLLSVCRNSGSLFPYCSFGFLFSPSDACFLCLSSSIACEFHLVSCKHLRVGLGWEWEMGSLGLESTLGLFLVVWPWLGCTLSLGFLHC